MSKATLLGSGYINQNMQVAKVHSKRAPNEGGLHWVRQSQGTEQGMLRHPGPAAVGAGIRTERRERRHWSPTRAEQGQGREPHRNHVTAAVERIRSWLALVLIQGSDFLLEKAQ